MHNRPFTDEQKVQQLRHACSNYSRHLKSLIDESLSDFDEKLQQEDSDERGWLKRAIINKLVEKHNPEFQQMSRQGDIESSLKKLVILCLKRQEPRFIEIKRFIKIKKSDETIETIEIIVGYKLHGSEISLSKAEYNAFIEIKGSKNRLKSTAKENFIAAIGKSPRTYEMAVGKKLVQLIEKQHAIKKLENITNDEKLDNDNKAKLTAFYNRYTKKANPCEVVTVTDVAPTKQTLNDLPITANSAYVHCRSTDYEFQAFLLISLTGKESVKEKDLLDISKANNNQPILIEKSGKVSLHVYSKDAWKVTNLETKLLKGIERPLSGKYSSLNSDALSEEMRDEIINIPKARLFYVNKAYKECTEINITDNQLKKFDTTIKPGAQARLLTENEKKKIETITGHTPTNGIDDLIKQRRDSGSTIFLKVIATVFVGIALFSQLWSVKGREAAKQIDAHNPDSPKKPRRQ